MTQAVDDSVRWSAGQSYAPSIAQGDPTSPEHHYLLGGRHKARNDWAAAEACYRDSLCLRPEYFEVWVSLGVLLRTTGRIAEAEACQREALRLQPKNFIALLNLGNVLFDLGRYEEARDLYRETIEQNPNSPEAHNNLARSLLQLRDINAGLHYLRALELKPDYFEAAEGMGKCLYQCDRYEEAAVVLATACRLRPNDINMHLNLANALMVSRQLDKALNLYEQLLQASPGLPQALAGMAAVLMRKGQYTKPRALYERALAADPGEVWIQANYAQLLLRDGDYVKGWENFEFRWRAEAFKDALNRPFIEQVWRGEALTGKSLMIVSEQGLGDELMFASIFPEIMTEARQCTIECDVRLEALFRRSFPGATIYGVQKKGKEKDWFRTITQHLSDLPHFDCWIPVGTLPSFRRRAIEDFPKHQGYLQADTDARRRWAARLKELPPGLKIGISWRGGVASTNASARSMKLPHLQSLLADKKCQFINLQYGDCREELAAFESSSGIKIHHWQEAIDDYDETAALVSELDLVISVCTSLVHLGGALGRPVWVMAPFVAEWRYGRQGPEMIWYPSIRMFRQPKSDDWTAVIADVRRALRKL